MACGKVSLVRSIYCSANFLFISFARPASLYCEEHVCVRVYVYIYIYTYIHTYIHTYICDYVEIVPLLPNNTASDQVIHFNTNRERCEVLTGYLSLWRQLGGDWANT